MQLIDDRPPNFESILAVFPMAKNPGIIFSYGDKIYAPGVFSLPPQLIAHEGVHGARQGESEESILSWWGKYLKDTSFRLAEEILAHQKEYQVACSTCMSRNERRMFLKHIATKLASPVYNRMISREKAMKIIKKG